MTISATDRYYRAETTPASITRLGASLGRAYGQPADAFGAKGNLVHASGYHRSRAWVLNSPDSRYRGGDYSVTQPLDQGGAASDVSAFDFTPGDWGTAENRRRMRELTDRVYRAAKAKDPRLANLRDFAGTVDGKTVITFNCADGSLKGAFDSSHLDHIHGSFWRSRCADDHTGVLAVLLGDTMTNPVEKTDAAYIDIAWSVDAIVDNDPVVGGGVDKGKPNGLAGALAGIASQASSNGGGISELKALMSELKALVIASSGPTGGALSDADVQRVAVAVADESARRQAE